MLATITRRLPAVFLVLILGGWPATAAENAAAEKPVPEKPAPDSPLSPAEALDHFALHPDLKIELVASEPQVIDPVAIRFDEEGRMWVVEMRDYPNGPQEGSPPKSRIKVLEDLDGDGRYETAHVFADGLLFATGIQPWKGGVIVTLAGKVEYMRDTDGDFKADQREVWFTGFVERNPQLRANHPTLGLDHNIYVANGLRGGNVVTQRKEWAKENAKPLSISGRDFRFNPLTGTTASVSGVGQFGLTFDDYGNRFICSNRNPCIHAVLDDRYIQRNAHLGVPSVVHDVSPAGVDSHVYPISRFWTTSTTHEGQFTAACGVTIYRGDLLPAEFYGNSFTCEPTGNLVHRDVLRPDGATFASHPGRDKVEFLATRDQWFRAVNLANGPDGALYVVDMHRAVIEHPQFMPTELKTRPDLRHGDDRGRIYRIVPAMETGKRRERPSLSDASTAELVALLDHANGWHRDTAFRLICEQQDQSAAGPLEALVQNGQSAPGRALALWALDGLDRLSAKTLAAALDDSHPRVQEQAARLAEGLFDTNEALADRVLKLAASDDARLRFQVALSLGELSNEQHRADVTAALAGIVYRDPSASWTRIAALSSSTSPADLLKAFARRVAVNDKWGVAGTADFMREIAEVIGSRQQKSEIRTAFFPLENVSGLPAATSNSADHDRIRFARLDGLARGLSRRGQSLRSYVNDWTKPDQARLNAIFQRAADVAADRDAEAGQRLAAIGVLQHTDYSLAGQPLRDLAAGSTIQSIQLAAIGTLAEFGNAGIGPLLLGNFASESPTVRRAILDALLADADRTRLLLGEIEAGRIRVAELDPSRTRRLLKHRNADIRQKAAQLLAAAVPEDRKKVLDEYQSVLSLEADALRGRAVFVKNCTACHRIGEHGVNVAPDIADSRTKKPAQLLLNILDPNRAVDNNYFSYTVITTKGKVITGLLSAETASSVTLRQQEDKTTTVLRQDIEEIHANGVSLMPVGLEKNINKQQMADLISFIKNWRYLDGRIPIEVE